MSVLGYNETNATELSEEESIRSSVFGMDKPEGVRPARKPREIRARIVFDLYCSPDWTPQVMDELVKTLQNAANLGIVSLYAHVSNIVAIPGAPSRPEYVDHFKAVSS